MRNPADTHTHSLLSRRLLYFPRLLKAMGWQEYPENDDNFLPLTEDELREFQTKTEQVGLEPAAFTTAETHMAVIISGSV